MAFCDVCDFDHYTYMCGSVKGHMTTEPTPAPPNPSDDCVTAEDRIYSGPDLDFMGTVNVLKFSNCFLFLFTNEMLVTVKHFYLVAIFIWRYWQQ